MCVFWFNHCSVQVLAQHFSIGRAAMMWSCIGLFVCGRVGLWTGRAQLLRGLCALSFLW